MPTFDARNLDTVDLVNGIRRESTALDRIPHATRANLELVHKNMTEFRPAWNEFVNALVNRIGKTILNNKRVFDNPLAEFKSGRVDHGDTVQEIAVGLLRARRYDPKYDGEDVFQRHMPNTKSLFYTLNRRDQYPLTLMENELRLAFLGNELGSYMDEQMNSLHSSDQYDEYLLMVQLLAEYHKMGGYHYVKAGSADILDKRERSADLLENIRAYAENLKYPNLSFNAAGMPVWARPEDVFVFTTPSKKAMLDVHAFAAAFNLDYMQAGQRIVTIADQHWPIELRRSGVHTVLTTRDFFRVFDNLHQTGDIYNPRSMAIHMFLNVWQTLAVNAFAPAIAFTDELETVTIPGDAASATIGTVAGVQVYPRTEGMALDSVPRGGEIAFDATVVLTEGEPWTGGVLWEVRGNESDRTTINDVGTVVVSPTETASTLTVRAYTTDPGIPEGSATLTLTGDVMPAIRDNRPEDWVDPEPVTEEPEPDPEP